MVGCLGSPFAQLIRLKTTKNKIPSQALLVESGAAGMVTGNSAPLFIPKMRSYLKDALSASASFLCCSCRAAI